MEIAEIDNNETLSSATTSLIPPPHRKFKSFTTQFYDDTNSGETRSNMTTVKRALCELELYLQLYLTNGKFFNANIDNSLLFWKEQEHLLSNVFRLAKQNFSILACSVTVERAFNSVCIVISHTRSDFNPSTVNCAILIRSAAAYLKVYS
ncbi:unnamed protein product [Rotaria sp. Silwood2]|nr:unnamed protein product [Rotaria sp. Silwood2]CAF2808322.1 unnamed protein product [Rotaria sp. Silwood2]CAF3008248.1 unnamed protein product [Rotaria sp. Silwood2]CAF4193979.1 unnamed protein product [Rotaria sp. Silwood2]CAF4267801.1 unnamed protein product [Rotaria sp. Silwood2]